MSVCYIIRQTPTYVAILLMSVGFRLMSLLRHMSVASSTYIIVDLLSRSVDICRHPGDICCQRHMSLERPTYVSGHRHKSTQIDINRQRHVSIPTNTYRRTSIHFEDVRASFTTRLRGGDRKELWLVYEPLTSLVYPPKFPYNYKEGESS